MDAPENNKDLSGLARSIDALFDGAGEGTQPTAQEADLPADPSGSPPAQASGDASADPLVDPPADPPGVAAGEEMVWEAVSSERPSRADEADPEAFREAVETFLASPPLERGGQASALRDHAMALRDANMLDALADAVERLTLGSGAPPDEACIAMARQLLSPGTTSRLVARLGSTRDEERREQLMQVVTRMGHEMALAIADALSDTSDRFARRSFMEAMVALGPEAMPVLESMMEDGRWFVVRNAVAILGEVGGERAVERITTALAHTEPKVRREALLSLAKVGGEDAGLLVYGMIEDPDPDVRLAAAMAAGALKVERALKPLLSLLEGENDEDVVVGVLGALGQLGDPGAVNAIEKRAVPSLFSRPPARVRIAAYRALHNIGTPHARQVLEDAADDKDPEVRAAVRNLLAAGS
ncbi:MAG: HEAT repeat domain-containing protein [Gemmatimonadota bacterium]